MSPAGLIWLTLVAGCAVLVGIASASVQAAGVAPIGIASCVTGAALGAALLAIATLCDWPTMKISIGLVIVATLLLVVAEHGWLYRDYRQQWERVRLENPGLAMFQAETNPLPIHHYLWREASPAKAAFWLLDALLIAATAVGIVHAWNRRYSKN